MKTVHDIKAGDWVSSRGNYAISCISGKILKANRVTLDIETTYMGEPMFLRIRRHDLRGEVKVKRGETICSFQN